MKIDSEFLAASACFDSEVRAAITVQELRDANRKIRQESDLKSCDGCICNFDIGDIYDVDGEQLCEGCKKIADKLKVLRSITGVELEQMAKSDPHMCKHLVMHLAPLIGWVAYIDTRKLEAKT